MTGAEPQVSGYFCFLPDILGGGDEEVTVTIGPGLSPPLGPFVSSLAITAVTLSQSVLSFPIPPPRISGPLSPGER